MAKRPSVDLIFVKLPASLDPKQQYCIAKIANENKYFVANRVTKTPFCGDHYHIGNSASELKNFLGVDAGPNDLCLICAGRDKRRTSEKDPRPSKSSKEEALNCEEEENKFIEYFKSIGLDRRDPNFFYSVVLSTKIYLTALVAENIQIPTSECILKFVYSHKSLHNNPPKYITESQSKIFGAEGGLFTEEPIGCKNEIGLYNGMVTFRDPKDLYTFQSEMAFGDLKQDFWVRGKLSETEITWTAKMNHKWEWKFDSKIPKGFVPLFANVGVSPELVMFAKRNIDSREELTIDYSKQFWEPDLKSRKLANVEHEAQMPPIYPPFWDLRNSGSAVVYDFFVLVFGQSIPVGIKNFDKKAFYFDFMSYYIYHSSPNSMERRYPISTIVMKKVNWEYVKNNHKNELLPLDIKQPIRNPRKHGIGDPEKPESYVEYQYAREYYQIYTNEDLAGNYRLVFAVNVYETIEMVAIFCISFLPFGEEEPKRIFGTEHNPVLVVDETKLLPKPRPVMINLVSDTDTEEEEEGEARQQEHPTYVPSSQEEIFGGLEGVGDLGDLGELEPYYE